jgi:hypothetical protein
MKVDATPVRVFGQLVTPNFFEFLGVTPSLGRGFRTEEGTTPGRDPVAATRRQIVGVMLRDAVVVVGTGWRPGWRSRSSSGGWWRRSSRACRGPIPSVSA